MDNKKMENSELPILAFQNRYIKHRILNYGQPYRNYTTYKIASNIDNIDYIFVDKQNCCNNLTSYGKDNGKDNINVALLHYYVEIHYTKESKKEKRDLIMADYEIDKLIEKYICIL